MPWSPYSLTPKLTFIFLCLFPNRETGPLQEHHWGGVVPTELGVLVILKELRLEGNNIEEGIPIELGQLESLSKSNVLREYDIIRLFCCKLLKSALKCPSV